MGYSGETVVPSFLRAQVEEVVSTGRERGEPLARARTSRPWADEAVSKGYLQNELRSGSGTESLGPATGQELAKPRASETEGQG